MFGGTFRFLVFQTSRATNPATVNVKVAGSGKSLAVIRAKSAPATSEPSNARITGKIRDVEGIDLKRTGNEDIERNQADVDRAGVSDCTEGQHRSNEFARKFHHATNAVQRRE